MKLLKWYNRVPLIYLNLGAFVLGCAGGCCSTNWGTFTAETF